MGITEERMAELAIASILADPAKYGGTIRMQVNGLTCTLNLPAALTSRHDEDGEEQEHALPPYARRPAFPVDEYAACPASWMRGSGREGSYFVPVRAGHGLWLDFNGNHGHTHDVAILVSVQGINPLTGQKTEVVRLEQYKENCPVHGKPFGQERFCEECGFKWPGQNYLATTGTPSGLLWLDGFRAKDGTVRQWLFTEEEMRGVAAQLIGSERVFAIGITFWLSKESKPVLPSRSEYRDSLLGVGHHLGGGGVIKNAGGLDDILAAGGPMAAAGSAWEPATRRIMSSNSPRRSTVFRGGQERVNVVAAKRLEVAAGARINQRVYDDPNPVTYWADEPAGTIYVHYATEAAVARIIAAGRRDLTAGGEGFMAGIVTGNSPNAPTGQQ